MSKENKGTCIIVTLIVLLIVLFTLAIGVVIGVFAVSEPDASNLQFWSSLGDALNPLIGFISAILVAAGLFYTARDFRLAREEFKASRVVLGEANIIEREKLEVENKLREGETLLRKLNQLEAEIKRYEFNDGISIHLLKDVGGTIELVNISWHLIYSLSNLSKILDCTDPSEFKNNEISKIIGGENYLPIEGGYDSLEWSVSECSVMSLFYLGRLIKSYIEAADEYQTIVGKKTLEIDIRLHRSTVFTIIKVLKCLCIMVDDKEYESNHMVKVKSGSETYFAIELSSIFGTSLKDSIILNSLTW